MNVHKILARCGAVLVLLALANVSSAESSVPDGIYEKGSDFAGTLSKARKNYRLWKAQADANLAEGVSFSPWKGSFGLSYRNGKASRELEEIYPSGQSPKFDAVYGGEMIWRDVDLPDATHRDLRPVLNEYRRLNIASWLYRTIESDKDAVIPVTLSSSGGTEIFLNGKKIGETKTPNDRRTSPLQVFNLNLKKGKNEFAVLVKSRGESRPMRFYFSPHADPAAEIAKKFEADYPLVANSLAGLAERAGFGIGSAGELSNFSRGINSNVTANLQAMPSLVSAADNSAMMEEAIRNALDAAFFSAGTLEKEAEGTFGDVSENGEIARAAIFEKIVSSIQVDGALGYDVKNVRAALEDMRKSFPDFSAEDLDALADYEKRMPAIREGLLRGDAEAKRLAAEFKSFASAALLKNPLLKKYPRWIYVKRADSTYAKGLPQNWQGNTSITTSLKRMTMREKKRGVSAEKVWDSSGYKDELWEMDLSKPGSAKFLFKPASPSAISDIDVSYDGKKVMYSTVDEKFRWNVDELDVETGKVRQITPRLYDDIDNYSAVYLPDGKIIYLSTACFVGVPCVAGTDYVANFYTLDPNAGSPEEVDATIRQLTFEQDADWMPVVMENGRVLYTRWEYVDNSHYFSRILMHMNPDGTAQSSFYGSTSYWPNSLFYCRPIPGDPNKFVGIVSGHHGIARSGELHLFDVSKGTIEESGRVHKFPSYGREYVAETKDELVAGKYPQFLHPYPLSEKYIVASARTAVSGFGIYLVDAFDNLTLIREEKGASLFEPRPLSERKKPQEIADKTDPDLDYGYVFLNDIYQGPGLKGVPRGSVKALRVFEYHYSYREMGGHDIVSNEGSWDIKRIFGTVPVNEDGSAMFKVPANRPVAIQPLDKDGKALALMRSWFTVMPGEVQSCVGCHEAQGMSPTTAPAMATRKSPVEIEPFNGPVRGWSFLRDIQPVLDQYCAGCHDGSEGAAKLPNFSRNQPNQYRNFPGAYMNLRRYVRTSGPESYQNLLAPLEFYADTSELIQLLEKGHKGVKLADKDMRTLIAWIDMNVSCLGTWKEVNPKIPMDGDKLRSKFLAKYANRHEDQEAIVYDGGKREFQQPGEELRHAVASPKSDKFPFSADTAAKMRELSGLPKEIVADLGGGVSMRFTLVPAGEFVMGSNEHFYDEGPARIEKIDKPFYMGQFEVSNAQFAAFDKSHNSGYFDRHYKDHVNRGYPANSPDQPVVRVTWREADAFCKWFGEKFGVKASLPTESQWEWAARAGSGKDFWFGDASSNYGAYENLSDWQTKKFAVNGIDPQPITNPNDNLAFIPRDDNVDDAWLVSAPVGSYKPNPFGLYDMFGNVAEWTSGDYSKTLGGEPVSGKKVARGGSWRDRAKWARATLRRGYFDWQKVFNVGFRLVLDDPERAAEIFKRAEELPQKPDRRTEPLRDNILK